ncbi:antigen like protein, partial [Clarias magur]
YSVLLALLLINRVSSQNVHVVNATLHKSVILPCSANRTQKAVFWLYNETIKVCDIIGGVMNLDEQNELYNNRVETFSSEFPKGNFSIKLNQLKMSDAGNYTCNFSEIPTPKRIQLNVT